MAVRTLHDQPLLKRVREVVSLALGGIAVAGFVVGLLVAFLVVCAFIPIAWIFKKED